MSSSVFGKIFTFAIVLSLLFFAHGSKAVIVSSLTNDNIANNGLTGITGSALDKNSGKVYVISDGQIKRLNTDGSTDGFTLSVSEGTPQGLAVDSSGYLYATWYYSNYVCDLNCGDPKSEQGHTNTAAGINKYNSSGSQIGQYGAVPGFLYYPHGIAVDSSGNMLVIDNGSLRKLNSLGSEQSITGFTLSNSGPVGIAIDSSNNVYVSSSTQIQKFNSSGTLLASYGAGVGNYGSDNAHFYNAQQIAVSSDGSKVFVADLNNGRVQLFSSNASSFTYLNTVGPISGVFAVAFNDATNKLWVGGDSFARYTYSTVDDTAAPVTTASPAGGNFSSTQSVYLTCSDNAAGCDKTYYTIDGTTPTTSSTVYNGNAIVISTTKTLKYFSVDRAGNTEGVNTQTYIYQDATAPSVTNFFLSTTASSLTFPMNSLVATDNVGVTGWIIKETPDNNAPTKPLSTDSGWQITGITGTTTVSVSGTITASTTGTRYFWAYVKDGNGNVGGPLSRSVTITLPDTVAPAVTAFSLSSAFTVPQTTFALPITTLTATDNASGIAAWMVKETATNSAPTAPLAADAGWQTAGITGSTSASITGNITTPSSGTRYFWAYVKDGNGNVSANFTSQSVAITSAINTATFDSSIKNFSNSAFGNISWTSGLVGSYLAPLSGTTFNHPNGLAMDSSGNLYVADTSNNVVKKYDGTNWTTLTGTTFSSPISIVIDSNNSIYVLDNGSVKKYNGSTWTTLGSTTFNSPNGMAVDSSGNVYVADYYNAAVKKYSVSNSSWSTIGDVGNFGRPNGVAIDAAGNIYVSDYTLQKVMKYTGSGWTLFLNLSGSYPLGLTSDRNGNLYYMDSSYLYKSVNGASFSRVLGVATGGSNNFALDSAGNMYFSQSSVNAVKILGGTSIKMRVRSGNTADGTGASWHAWDDTCLVTNGSDISDTGTQGDSQSCVHDGDSYIQYEAIMNTDSGTNSPMLTGVTISTQATYPTDITKSWLISSPFNTSNPNSSVQSISWTATNANENTQGAVEFQIRTAPDNGGVPDWSQGSGWCGADPDGAGSQTGCAATKADTDFSTSFYKDTDNNRVLDNPTINPSNSDTTGNQWIQYATFLRSKDGTVSTVPSLSGVTLNYTYNQPPAISNVTYHEQLAAESNPGSVKVDYTIANQNNNISGTQNAYALLFYQQDNGIKLASALDSTSTGNLTFTNTNNRPIPAAGTMLIDGELIEYNNGTTDNDAHTSTVSILATGGSNQNDTGRGANFDGEGGTFYTNATTHPINAPIYFRATKNTSGGNLYHNDFAFTSSATTANRTFNWDAKNDLGDGVNLSNSLNLIVVANDGNSTKYNNVSAVTNSTVNAKSLDLQTPTISSISTTTTAGAYKQGTTIPLTVTFSENVTSTGAVRLTLNSGATCDIASILNTNIATCSYLIGANDKATTALKVTNIAGTIKDQFANAETDFNIPANSNLDANNTKAIIIDNFAPTVGAGSDVNANGQFNQTATVSDDNSGLDEATYVWSKASGPGNITFGAVNQLTTSIKADREGTYVIQFLAKDKAGNQTISSFNLNWDTTAPTFDNLTDKAANAQFTQVLANVVENGSGVATYVWTKKTGTGNISFGSPDQNNTTISADTDGNYVIQIVVTDKAGNSITKTMNLAWDSNAPTFDNIPDKAANAQFTQNLTNLTDGTGSGIDTYTWTKKSGTGNINFSVANAPSTNISADADGVYVIQIDVKDKAGNIATKTMDLTWDTQAPQFDDLSSKTTNAEFTQTLGNVTDGTGSGIGTIAWSKVSGPAGGIISFGASDQTSTTISASKDGNYLIQVVVTDKATNSTAKTFNLVWDTVAPTGTFAINNNPANPKYINSKNVTLNSNITDTNGSGVYQMSFSNDNSTWSAPEAYAATKDWTLTDGDGEKTVYARFTDNAGNTYEVNDKIILDSTAPVITFTQDIQSLDPVQSQNVAIHLDEANTASATYIFSVDTSCETKDYAQAQAFTSDQTITINNEANNGKYICAKVTDKSDNTSYKASSNPLNIDVTAPNLSFASDVQAGPVQSNDINITASETNPNTYKYGFTQSNCDSSITFDNTFAAGTAFTINDESHNTNYICAQAIDKAGNTTYIKSSKTLNIDVTKPVVSFTDDVQQNPTQSDTVQINVNEINPNKYGYVFADDDSCDTKDYANQTIFTSDQTITFNSEASNNKYICVKAEDKAGNVTYQASQNKLNIDVTAPQISFADDVDQGPTQVDTININSTEANPDTYKYGFTSNTCDQTVSFGNNFTPSQVITIDKDFIRDTQNGNYICAQAIDQAGNTSYKKSTNKLNIDIVAPKFDHFDVDKQTVTDPANAYGAGVSIEVRAYYQEDLKDASTMDVRMDLAATDKPDSQKSDGDRNVTNLILHRDATNPRMLKGSFTIEGPRKGYDTTALSIRQINSENAIDLADNIQSYSTVTAENNISAIKTIIIDTGTPALNGFSATQGIFKKDGIITLTANYSKDIKTGSIKVKLNTSDQEFELKAISASKKDLTGTYKVGELDNVDDLANLKVISITSQSVTDYRNQTLATDSMDFDEYNSYAVANDMPSVSNISDGTRVDTKAPSNSIVEISKGAVETKEHLVELKIETADNFALDGMKIQISNNGSTWCDANGNLNAKSDYTTTIPNWDMTNSACGNQPLPQEDTDNIEANIYVKYIDAANNETIANDGITYSGVPPRIVQISSDAIEGKIYGPGMTINVSLKYNKPLSEDKSLASTATVYFANGSYASLTKTASDTLSGLYTIEVGQDTQNLALLMPKPLSQNVYSTSGSLQDSDGLPQKMPQIQLAPNSTPIIVDTKEPTGQMFIDRSINDGESIKLTFNADDGNAIKNAITGASMKARIKVLDSQTDNCSFENQPLIDVEQKENTLIANFDDAYYSFNKDGGSPKKVCLQLTDQAGNKSEIITATTPETPQNLAVTDNSNISAGFYGTFVTWKIPADDRQGTNGWRSYELFHCSNNNSTQTDCVPNDSSKVVTISRDNPDNTINTNFASFNGLTKGNRYCYRIRFRDNNHDGDGNSGDYSSFSPTKCIVTGENVQLSTAQIDVRNGDGDISIYDVTKSGATIKFVTQDLQQNANVFPTIAKVEVYGTYSNLDKDGNIIQNKDNWLQDKVATFSDSIVDGKIETKASHTIKLASLMSGKSYYLKIIAIDPAYYMDKDESLHTKVIAYDGEKGVNSELTFTTLGALSKIYNISDPPTILSDKDVVIDFKTDQNANCMIEYGKNSVAQAQIQLQNQQELQSTADESCTNKANGVACSIGSSSGTCDGNGKCVALSSISNVTVKYDELPVTETEGEFTTNHSIHLPSPLSTLSPQTVYYYKITCTDGALEKESWVYSPEGKFRTLDRQMTEADFAGRVDGTAPTISNISIPTLTGENATVTWNTNEPSNSLVAYELEGTDFMLMAGDYAVNADHNKYATSHTVNIAGLLPASKYTFTVISTDASGNIGQATASSFTTKLPSSLSSIKVVSTALGQATITWSTGSPSSSEIEYGLTMAYGQKKQDSTKTRDHSIILEGLTPGQTYHFRVKGEDDQSNIFASSDITFQPQAPPKIDNFKVDSITEHSAIVTFTTNVPTSALVTYANTDNTDDNGAQGKFDMLSNHKIELKNLTSGEQFSVKIKVTDESGNETEENFANFTTTKDEKPPVIDRIKTDSALTQNDKVQAIISWTTDELATGQVVYKEGKTGEEKTFDVNTSPSFSHVGVITTFKPGTVYYFNVKSTDAAGNVSKSTDYALLTPKQSQNIIQIIIGNFTDIFGWAKFGN